MKITIEAEPKELAALILELQKQLDITDVQNSWDTAMQNYLKSLKIKNPNLII